MKHTVSQEVLSTGTKGLLIDVPGSEVINIKLFFRAGFQLADRKKYEAPHLIEHHIFNGSKKFPQNGQLFTELSKNGAGSNATTDPHFITYLNECAEFEYERIFDLYIDLIQQPLFPAEQYIIERENVRSELSKKMTDYSIQAYVLSAEANFPDIWLNYKSRISQLEDITHEDVVSHYSAFHKSANASFVISGAVEKNRKGILKKLEQLFGGLPLGTRSELIVNVGKGSLVPIVQHEKIAADNFHISWFSEGGTDAQQAASRLLTTVLTGSFLSRILGKARDKGLTYSVNSGSSIDRYSSSLTIAGFANPNKLKGLFEVISTELADIASFGPKTEELLAARDRVVGGIKVHTQTAGSVAGWYAREYAFDGTIQSYDEYFDLLQAVTVDSVRDTAQKLLETTYHSTCHVGPITSDIAKELEDKLKPVWH